MSYQFYKLLHIIGIAALFMAFGAMAMHGWISKERIQRPIRTIIAITHGVALALILVAGFGLLAKTGHTSGFPGWVYPKFIIWLVFGAAISLLIRRPKLGKFMWIVLPLWAGLAAYYAIYKPGA